MRISDWSSDVCSSDLCPACGIPRAKILSRSLSLRSRSKSAEVDCRLESGPGALGGGRSRPRLACRNLAARWTSGRHDQSVRGSNSSTTCELLGRTHGRRSEEHTSELQSLMRISYAVFRL